jgi:hypothetical protein
MTSFVRIATLAVLACGLSECIVAPPPPVDVDFGYHHHYWR